MRSNGNISPSKNSIHLSRHNVFFLYNLLFVVLIIAGFIWQLELPGGSKNMVEYAGVLAVFDHYFVEVCVLFLLAGWLLNQNLYLRSFLYLSAFLFAVIYTAQFSSFFMVKEYISRLALENANHIELLINPRSLLLSAFLFLIWISLPLLIEKTSQKSRQKRPILSTIILLCTITLLLQSHRWLPEKIISQRNTILDINFLTHTAPITSLYQTLFIEKSLQGSETVDNSFSRYELQELKKFGFHYNVDSDYPLIKETIYSGPAPFQKLPDSTSTPNILIFFTEGYSARGMTPYTTKYSGITPNLDEFSSTSMVVDNYYNHTGATYRGLHGQLCSLFPTYGGIGGWQTNYEDLPDTNYHCLTNIFNKLEYETIFLDAHKPEESQVDEMVARLGFKEVLTGIDLSKRYLNNSPPLRKESYSDKQFYRGLVGYLKDRAEKGEVESPFFMGLYNLGTHAFIRIPKDGFDYGDGKNRSLDKIHTLDKAFGIFWEYYKRSPYAKNTIVIFTADHCHYPEKPFIQAFKGPDYQPFFVDRIPFIIHDPTRTLPKRYDANYATSLGFAPSIIHYLELENHKNPFLGTSIFEKKESGEYSLGVNSYGEELFITAKDTIHKYPLSESFPVLFKILDKFVRVSKQLEVKDRLWDTTLNEQIPTK